MAKSIQVRPGSKWLTEDDRLWDVLDFDKEDQFLPCSSSHPAGLDTCAVQAKDKAGKKVLLQCQNFEYEDEYDPKYTCICRKCLVRGGSGQCEKHIYDKDHKALVKKLGRKKNA